MKKENRQLIIPDVGGSVDVLTPDSNGRGKSLRRKRVVRKTIPKTVAKVGPIVITVETLTLKD